MYIHINIKIRKTKRSYRNIGIQPQPLEHAPSKAVVSKCATNIYWKPKIDTKYHHQDTTNCHQESTANGQAKRTNRQLTITMKPINRPTFKIHLFIHRKVTIN